ncbi:putative Ig domain-containing protein [Streptomyces sp. NPDC032161]|uniref:putative Ig domain-containing protein n=1 Tax=unclassified Streptomyces TaxID=2593676 RepID=UPI0033C4B50A
MYVDPALLPVIGSLPPGLTLAPTGLIHGTPTAPGSYTFGVAPFDDRGDFILFEIQVS